MALIAVVGDELDPREEREDEKEEEKGEVKFSFYFWSVFPLSHVLFCV